MHTKRVCCHREWGSNAVRSRASVALIIAHWSARLASRCRVSGTRDAVSDAVYNSTHLEEPLLSLCVDRNVHWMC